MGPLPWSRWLPDLHAGLGSRFRGVARGADLVLWGGLLAAASVCSPALLATPLFLLGWGWWLRRAIGGVSGDGHGAGIRVPESLSLFAALLCLRRACATRGPGQAAACRSHSAGSDRQHS